MDRNEALDLLRGGRESVAEWNRRRNEGEAIPTLEFASLHGLQLREVDFSGAYLHGANFSESRLGNANFQYAFLRYANFNLAQLINTNLSDTHLQSAQFTNSVFSSTDLRRAHLENAFLMPQTVHGSRFEEAVFGNTTIGGVLSAATGLEHVVHSGPSKLSVYTLLARPLLPESFLRGCGLADEEIEHFRRRVGSPVRYYSGFISYSHADIEFANRLHDQLQGRGIRCWRDETHLRVGDRLQPEINEAIRVWDKTLLCCSEQSLTSEWVEKEIVSAFHKEHILRERLKEEVLVLIPLDLDGYLFSAECKCTYAPQLGERLAARFKGWETDSNLLDREFEKVVAAMRSDAAAREAPPAPQLWPPRPDKRNT